MPDTERSPEELEAERIKKERIKHVRALRREYRSATKFVEGNRYSARQARRYADRLEAFAHDAAGRISDIETNLQEELEVLGRESGADKHCDAWLREFDGLSPEDKATAIQGLLNVAEDTIREGAFRRREYEDMEFLGLCRIYTRSYREEIERICREHGLERVVGGRFRRKA